MKKERIVIATQTGKSNNHYVVSSTIQVIENRTIVWVYQDNAKDRLLEGRDDKSTRLHIKCNLMTDNNSRIIRHVSVMDIILNVRISVVMVVIKSTIFSNGF